MRIAFFYGESLTRPKSLECIMSSIVLQHRDTIIQRMQRGDRLTDIAKDLGLTSHAAISMRLSKDPEYIAARIASLASRLDQREAEMEIAADSVTIARTRELLSHARWRAEREAPDIWGAKPTSTAGGITINVSRDGVSIEQDRPPIDHNP